jgi:hypothetical protein
MPDGKRVSLGCCWPCALRALFNQQSSIFTYLHTSQRSQLCVRHHSLAPRSVHPSHQYIPPSPSLTDSQDLPNQRRPMHQLLHESLLHRYYNYCRTAQHVMTHGDSMSYGGQREEDPK